MRLLFPCIQSPHPEPYSPPVLPATFLPGISYNYYPPRTKAGPVPQMCSPRQTGSHTPPETARVFRSFRFHPDNHHQCSGICRLFPRHSAGSHRRSSRTPGLFHPRTDLLFRALSLLRDPAPAPATQNRSGSPKTAHRSHFSFPDLSLKY